MTPRRRKFARFALKGAALSVVLLAGCENGVDLGGLGASGFNLNDPSVAGVATSPAPKADSRGLISYPTYQVAEARQGDNVAAVANRLGLSPATLARHNGLKQDSRLRAGELLALPGPVAKGAGASGVAAIESIASSAIAAADKRKTPLVKSVLPANAAQAPAPVTSGASVSIEPIKHQVERGETAYSIARLYNVSVTALARWNRLGPDLAVREGQQLLIPIVDQHQPAKPDQSKPGAVSVTPVPPSASKPLPKKLVIAKLPASPDLKKYKSKPSAKKFLMPVSGKIISKYTGKKGSNDGIDIGAIPGTAVVAAADGEVALISNSVDSSSIVLLRHKNNIYTVYSNISGVRLSKGQQVQRGQRIGVVAKSSPSYLHFEIRRGTQSLNPMPFL